MCDMFSPEVHWSEVDPGPDSQDCQNCDFLAVDPEPAKLQAIHAVL